MLKPERQSRREDRRIDLELRHSVSALRVDGCRRGAQGDVLAVGDQREAATQTELDAGVRDEADIFFEIDVADAQ